MLLQSYDGYLYLLPALPNALPNGWVKGLKASGGFEIDLDWKNSKLNKITIKSTIGGNARIRVAKNLNLQSKSSFTSAKGENKNEYYQFD